MPTYQSLRALTDRHLDPDAVDPAPRLDPETLDCKAETKKAQDIIDDWFSSLQARGKDCATAALGGKFHIAHDALEDLWGEAPDDAELRPHADEEADA